MLADLIFGLCRLIEVALSENLTNAITVSGSIVWLKKTFLNTDIKYKSPTLLACLLIIPPAFYIESHFTDKIPQIPTHSKTTT